MKQLKCTRRTFLKTAAATSVALGLTSAGAPVALAEGNATQAAGDVQKIRTHCRACGKMECAIWAWVQDGRVIDLTGDESAISSRGHICAKGKSAMQALYHPDRVRYPMKRTNPKGEDPGWVRISWDEALELGAKGFQEVIDKYGGPAIKSLHGTSRITSYGSMLFGYYVGSPNGGCTAGQVCKGPRTEAGALTCFPAHWVSLNEGCKVFFQWGTNQEVSNYDNANRVTVDSQVNARKSICVGPRLQNLGKECDIKVHLRPGTDDAFGMGMLNIIVNEMKTYDEMFAKKWTDGPFLFVEELEPTPFDWQANLDNQGYPLTVKTRLLKESDVKEGGSVRRFMVWDKKGNRLTWFDSETGLWEGETEYIKPTKMTKIGEGEDWCGGFLPEENGFSTGIDPALDGEYEVTLKDGRKVSATPTFKLFTDGLAEWTPERVAEHCEIDVESLREAAQEYGCELMQGGIQYQLALEHAGNAIQATRIPLILSALTGNLDTPGGNRGGETVHYLYNCFFSYVTPFGAPMQDPALRAKVAGGDKFPLLPFFQTIGGAAFHHDQTSATDMILTGKPYPIRAMISATGSHHHSGNANRNWEAFKSLDFYWAAELWHSPTVELADVLVPACHFLEIDTLRISQGAESGFGAQVAVVPPQGEAKWDTIQIIQLCKKMGIPWWPTSAETAPPFWPKEWLDIQWPDEQQVNEMSIFHSTHGMQIPGPEGKKLEFKDWDDFKEQWQEHGQWDLREVTPIGYYRRHMLGYMRKDGLPGWETPTTKFELWSTLLETYHPGEQLPVVREPVESPYSTPDVAEEYPIILTSGRRIPVFFHSEGRQQPFAREQAVVPTFQINPETAKELGIEQGDWCWIESRRGKIRQVADLFYGIAPGVVEADHGWWFPELPAPTHGYNLSNINCLVDDTAQDPISGATTLRAYLVKIYKATPENCPNGVVIPCADEDGTPIITDANDPRLKAWMPVKSEEV
ncbi:MULTISPECIES: molybdopterin-containing oxidoreductase family protein [Gordonibacter]|uniref:Molybdopterin-dependent oxidoreductase n=1 Tax=Gordonibacter faecis TaxID=3047475 RepID=A0ABT7DP52_9ACTN|nr:MULTISPECIES: molybdopterin-dependent oxidoreductase [unclassified Gordonibacter]MDJ1651327.1 molybdopterin-dependent oxidoreductase [Gordonibacter sp. KGMB12511]